MNKKRKTAVAEFENLPANEKKSYSSFEDYLGANAQCICEMCDNVVEYDEVDENGYCCDCQNGDEEGDDGE